MIAISHQPSAISKTARQLRLETVYRTVALQQSWRLRGRLAFPRSWCCFAFPDGRWLTADGCLQIRHLHRRQRRLKSLVPQLQAGAINRLLQRVACQHAKRMRDSSLLRRLPDAASNLIHDHIVMRRIAADQAAEANDGVIFFGFGKRASGQGNLERARHAGERDVFLLRARAQQPVVGALKEPFRDEGVEARDYNCEPFSGGAESAFDSSNLQQGKTFKFYFLFRFSLRSSASRR